MEYLAGELQSAKVEAKLHQTEATTYSELLPLQMSLEESENHRSEAERKELEGRKCQELLAAELESLKKELAYYKDGEEGCRATQKNLFLKSPEFFDLLGSQFAFLPKQGFKGVIK